MKSIIFTAMLTSVLLAACNNAKKTSSLTTPADDPTALNGTWQLNYITGPRIAFDGLYPDKKPQITFDIAAKRVSGNTSCNSFSGVVTVDMGKIDLTAPMATTKMACAGEGEFVFLSTLKKINSWSITEGKTLNLIMGDIAMMRFTKIN